MPLLCIGEQLTIYGGFFFLTTGIVSNVMNRLIFSDVRSYRRAPSTFYFLVGSIENLVYIMINLISRIVSTCYGIDLTRTSSIWCKTRICFYSYS